MSTGFLIRLILQLLVFAAWVALSLSTWRQLQARAEAEGDGTIAPQLRQWLRRPEDRSARRALLALTVVLVLMMLSAVFLTPPPPAP